MLAVVGALYADGLRAVFKFTGASRRPTEFSIVDSRF